MNNILHYPAGNNTDPTLEEHVFYLIWLTLMLEYHATANHQTHTHPTDTSKKARKSLNRETIVSILEALIKWMTRSIKSHDYVEQSIARLQTMKQKSFTEKKQFIQTILEKYKHHATRTSRTTAKLLDELAKKKPIDEHIESLIAHLNEKDANEHYIHNGSNMFVRICEVVNTTHDNTASTDSVIDQNGYTAFATQGVAVTLTQHFNLFDTLRELGEANAEYEQEETQNNPRSRKTVAADHVPPKYDNADTVRAKQFLPPQFDTLTIFSPPEGEPPVPPSPEEPTGSPPAYVLCNP